MKYDAMGGAMPVQPATNHWRPLRSNMESRLTLEDPGLIVKIVEAEVDTSFISAVWVGFFSRVPVTAMQLNVSWDLFH